MYTLGSDPEFFVMKDKNPFPAYRIISGTKENPNHLGDGYSILHDNTLIEGNIPPAHNVEEFVTNMRKLKIKMNKILRPFHCEIAEDDVKTYTDDDLKDPRAKEFGCSPFTDGWTFEERGAPEIKHNYRTAGFHIHVGYENNTGYPNELVNIALSRAFDFFAVLPAKMKHSDSRRDGNYGGFGKFRHKPYGLELRSLGGYFSQDIYLKWVYEQTVKAVDFVLEGNTIETLLDLSKKDLTVDGAADKLGLLMINNEVREKTILVEPRKLVT